MLDLRDFEQLRKRLEIKDPKETIRVFLFSKEETGIKIYSEKENENHLSFLSSNNPTGKVGEVFISEKNFFIGIGKKLNDKVLLRTNVSKAMKNLYENLKRFDKSEIIFEDCEFTEDALFAFILTSYSYDFLKKSKDECSFLLRSEKYKKIIEIAHFQNIVRFLGDTPANLMTPTLFSEYSKKLFEGDKNVELEILSKDFLKENNMNLVLSVSQGSEEEPKLLRIKYSGNKAEENVNIALVGKGVTFDTGGISIKPSLNMHLMKQDMLGAATMLCLLKLASILGIKKNITATLPLVENMPSGSATKPGDVFKSMSGLTVQVDNTDAEGRLILADALTLAQKDNPEYLLDIATLTGAMIISLGNVYAGYFTDDDE